MKTLTTKMRVNEVTPKSETSPSAIDTIAPRASVRTQLAVMQM
jgi:hypothetical protein